MLYKQGKKRKIPFKKNTNRLIINQIDFFNCYFFSLIFFVTIVYGCLLDKNYHEKLNNNQKYYIMTRLVRIVFCNTFYRTNNLSSIPVEGRQHIRNALVG